MTLVVHAGIYRPAVIRHLALLVPPEVWTIDEFGFVDLVGSVPPSLATPAVRALQAIIGVNGLVEIFGSEAAAEIVVDGSVQKIGDVGGAAFIDPNNQGPNARVPIIYDSSDNYGDGYWVRGADGSEIDCPAHIILGHELAHAIDALEATYTQATSETSAILMENALRAAATPTPLPLRGTHEGGKKTAPKKSPTMTTPKSKGGCFIATAVASVSDMGRLNDLRRFRDTQVRAVARGAAYMDAFYAGYGEAGARIATQIADDPEERKLLWSLLVAPVLSYLTLAVECPEEPVDVATLTEPWAAFACELQENMQCWAVSALPPMVVVPPDDADFVARYVLRSHASRQLFAESCAAGRDLPALLKLVADAKLRFANTVGAIQREDSMAGALPDNSNPLVTAIATMLSKTVDGELRGLRSAFDAAGHGSVFDTAFIGPLAHYMRLAALLPSGDLPDGMPRKWQAVIARLRDEIDVLSQAVMSAAMAVLGDAQANAAGSAPVGAHDEAVHVARAFGNDVGTPTDTIRWRYTVTLRNADEDNATYLNLRVYYLAQPGGPEDMGLVTLPNLLPGEVAVFPLCECRRLMSYLIKGDLVLPDGTTGNFIWPDDNGMTAKRAGDPHPCEDSWAF